MKRFYQSVEIYFDDLLVGKADYKGRIFVGVSFKDSKNQIVKNTKTNYKKDTLPTTQII
jgi:hypothetical protein